jgi:hypothetical protein
MLRRLGIRRRPANVDRLTILGARCVGCTAHEECDAWLAAGETAGNHAFCPNAGELQRLAREKAKLAAP